MRRPWAHLHHDLPAAIVVFLVALPLCLGIALASGTPLLSGLFAGMIGGLVVGALSGSHVSVSGPAAGLTVIVAAGIAELGSYPAFLTAVILAGLIQCGLGLVRAGVLAHFVPAAVVHGMLAAIGCILILKQIPHALGHDADYEGDESFVQVGGGNTFSELLYAIQHTDPGAVTIFAVALASLLAWQRYAGRLRGWLPAPLVGVLAGTATNFVLRAVRPGMQVEGSSHMVAIPDLGGLRDIVFALPFPDPFAVLDPTVWKIAVTVAVIASVESLLSVGASDKLDPLRRLTPTNRELRAQGVGNIVAGLLGALPVTAVIVRSSANISAGARTKLAAILHGGLLLLSVLVMSPALNYIPLAALAAVLIVMGWRLTSPRVVRGQVKAGVAQAVPFFVTLLAILLTDLLVGVLIGIGVGIFFVIRSNFRSALVVTRDGANFLIRFAKDVSFLNKPALVGCLEQIPEGAVVLIDGTRAQFVDHDIEEALEDFVASAPARGIHVELRRTQASLNEFFKETPA